jgi:hypothetical protein
VTNLRVDGDFASVRPMHSAENADQGRFSGSVLAHERVQLARQYIEIHVSKRSRRAEMFGNPTGTDRRFRHASAASALHRHACDVHRLGGFG